MLWFFFFQAEDGIRDDLVTGVQTCALPICLMGLLGCSRVYQSPSVPLGLRLQRLRDNPPTLVVWFFFAPGCAMPMCIISKGRSEERRVGKERRARGRRYMAREDEMISFE